MCESISVKNGVTVSVIEDGNILFKVKVAQQPASSLNKAHFTGLSIIRTLSNVTRANSQLNTEPGHCTVPCVPLPAWTKATSPTVPPEHGPIISAPFQTDYYSL